MKVEHEDNQKKGRFFIEEEGHLAAAMTYVWAGSDKIIVDHTEVDDQFKGKGLGNILVDNAVDFARKKNIKIIPLCPFASKVLKGSDQYTDIIA